MKRSILTIMLLSLLVAAGPVFSETPANSGPEIIRFNMGDLVLPFRHWKHQKSLNNECHHCHGSTIGKIDAWDKDTAHLICISCHTDRHKGPTECIQCHSNIYSRK